MEQHQPTAFTTEQSQQLIQYTLLNSRCGYHSVVCGARNSGSVPHKRLLNW